MYNRSLYNESRYNAVVAAPAAIVGSGATEQPPQQIRGTARRLRRQHGGTLVRFPRYQPSFVQPLPLAPVRGEGATTQAAQSIRGVGRVLPIYRAKGATRQPPQEIRGAGFWRGGAMQTSQPVQQVSGSSRLITRGHGRTQVGRPFVDGVARALVRGASPELLAADRQRRLAQIRAQEDAWLLGLESADEEDALVGV